MALHDTLLEFFELVLKQICEIRRDFFQLLPQLFYLGLLFTLNLIMFCVQLLDVLLEFGLHVLLAFDGKLVLMDSCVQANLHSTISLGHLFNHVSRLYFVLILFDLHVLRLLKNTLLLAETIIRAVLLHHQLLLECLNVSL